MKKVGVNDYGNIGNVSSYFLFDCSVCITNISTTLYFKKIKTIFYLEVNIMIEQLTKVWKSYETRELAKIFETYMKNIGAKKHILNNSTYEKKDGKPNSYFIDGKTTGWNRVQLYYCKEPFEFCNEDLEITLRKRAGNYLIIARKGERAFEVDYSGLRNYNESLMNEIYSDHKELFDVLFEGGKT